jgi:hypothetical protein
VESKRKMIDQKRIEQLAKEAGFVQGPWANGIKKRIWQENREFPDALEVFAKLIAKECVKAIGDEIAEQQRSGIISNTMGLNQARYAIEKLFDGEVLC